MKAVLQRVAHSSVSIEGQMISSIGKGLLILLGIEREDGIEKAQALSKKIVHLRIFEDAQEKMNLSVLDIQGEVLVISQFTLMADAQKGNRPSFVKAAPPEIAKPLIEEFCRNLHGYGLTVKQGVFGAHMAVDLLNDGPVTIWLEN
ncbi:MAG: D-tyrosyl-tRNA(Tyr) deacylase [Pelolinea sp.]|jgi:D-tyrosyl-tRNA(Tyr) deacylase|nr:D-tyrosyl-tRNA(Tyr) deacylase [Pelolinea sp.]